MYFLIHLFIRQLHYTHHQKKEKNKKVTIVSFGGIIQLFNNRMNKIPQYWDQKLKRK